jgi:putative acetyltransferase
MLAIRPEQPKDYPTVFEIHHRAFGRLEEAELVEKLRSVADPQISLVAELDGQVVGHIFFSPVTIEGENSSFVALGLAPMAVWPGLQNRGIGSQLVRVGLETARKSGHTAVVVLGHRDYYPRFGFEVASRKGLRCEFPAPDEAFLVVELEPEALHGRSGLVKYLPAFSSV